MICLNGIIIGENVKLVLYDVSQLFFLLVVVSRHQLIHSLEQLAAERCSEKVFVSLENKIDLAQPGHIQPVFEAPYRMRQLIRISFLNVEDARTFRRELESRIKRNQEFVQRLAASALQETGERAGGADRGVGKNTHHRVFLGLQREIQTQLDADPLSLADGLLETDIPLVSRLCIDTGIRCGKWYDVRAEPGEQIQVISKELFLFLNRSCSYSILLTACSFRYIVVRSISKALNLRCVI